MMKAIVYTKYGPPDVLQYQDVEKPVPKDNEVLIKIHATTVTVADTRARGFKVPTTFWIPARITLGITSPKSKILGMELAGVVESVGKNVTRFKEGDHVFAATLNSQGAYAEYKCMPEDGPIAIKPKNISFEEAAAIPIGARTALHHLGQVNIEEGQKVLVYGASGSVGSYAVQLAKFFGAEVTGVCSTTNVDLVKSLGADHVIDYKKDDFSKSGVKYDIIFEAVGKSSFSDCMKVLKDDGSYINISIPLPSIPMFWTQMTSKRKIVPGQNSPETPDALNFLRELVEADQLKVAIDAVYPLSQAAEAHTYVDKGHKKGNVVLKIV